MIDFFQYVPTYWSKDDHDFRYNDSDNETDRQPLPDTGISLFHEQLPNAAQGPDSPKTYRTIRVSRDLQIWLTEGRDYRSPNKPVTPNGNWSSPQLCSITLNCGRLDKPTRFLPLASARR